MAITYPACPVVTSTLRGSHATIFFVERVVRRFDSFEDAEQAEAEYYAGLSPTERLEILLDLIARYRESLGEAAERFERVHRIIELSQS